MKKVDIFYSIFVKGDFFCKRRCGSKVKKQKDFDFKFQNAPKIPKVLTHKKCANKP